MLAGHNQEKCNFSIKIAFKCLQGKLYSTVRETMGDSGDTCIELFFMAASIGDTTLSVEDQRRCLFSIHCPIFN